MAVGEVSKSDKKLVYVINNPTANVGVYTACFVKKGMVRLEWEVGVTIQVEFISPGNSYNTGAVTSGELDVYLTFNPETIYTISSTNNNVNLYVYEIAMALPSNVSGTLTTITSTGTYNISGLAEVYVVGGGSSGGGGGSFTTGGSAGEVKSFTRVYLPSSPYPVTIGAGAPVQPYNTPPTAGGNTQFISPTYLANGNWTPGGATNASGTASNAVTSAYPSLITGSTGSGGGGASFGGPNTVGPAGGGGNGGIGTGGGGGIVYGSGGFPSFRAFIPWSYSSTAPGFNGTGFGAGGGGGTASPDTAQTGGSGTQGVVYVLSINGARQT